MVKKSYESVRMKIKKLVDNSLIPKMKESPTDFDYYKTIAHIAELTSCSEIKVEEYLKSLVKTEKLAVILTLSDKETTNWLEEDVKERKALSEEVDEVLSNGS